MAPDALSARDVPNLSPATGAAETPFATRAREPRLTNGAAPCCETVYIWTAPVPPHMPIATVEPVGAAARLQPVKEPPPPCTCALTSHDVSSQRAAYALPRLPA
jgi:hypothetical protein